MVQGQYAPPAFQPASFTPVDAVIPGYTAMQQAAAQAGVNSRNAAQAAERAAADATIDANAADSEAAANRETSARTNSLATMLATQRRTPGGGIRMGGRGRTRFSANSAGGLNRANTQTMAAKKKAAAQAQLTSKYAGATQSQNQAAQQQYNNRFIGFQNGVLYV